MPGSGTKNSRYVTKGKRKNREECQTEDHRNGCYDRRFSYPVVRRKRSFIAAHYQTSGSVDSLLLSIHKTVDVFAKAGLKSLSVGLAETSLGSCAFRIGLRHGWRVTSVLPLQMTLRSTNVSLTLTCRLGLCFFYFTSSNQLCRSTLLAFCIT